jgi:predicted GH43/DUF377 family glycosyl hydrolase
MNVFQMRRLRVLMEPQTGNSQEAFGVLNPAAARGPDGSLYLFPRLVSKGNYSRIGVARVLFDSAGEPTGVERLGVALEPQADYELRPDGGGGCEDPRVTYVEPLHCYIMTYTAFSPIGPRIALASSTDLLTWRRMGLATFAPYSGIDFVHVDNKDASLFPIAVPNHVGKMQLAILHRPLFVGTRPEETARRRAGRIVDLEHESIWISYCPIKSDCPDTPCLGLFNSHHRLATPVSPWEKLKIGGGAPPILTRHGWLIIYHGVSDLLEAQPPSLCYSAGVMVLSKEHPLRIRYRSREPVLAPSLPKEREGMISNVVFPTGIDRRDDLGLPSRIDVYYGMADSRIGVARLDIPAHLPHNDGIADSSVINSRSSPRAATSSSASAGLMDLWGQKRSPQNRFRVLRPTRSAIRACERRGGFGRVDVRGRLRICF